MKLDPHERMTPLEALEHPWIVGHASQSSDRQSIELFDSGWMLTENEEGKVDGAETRKPRASLAYRTVSACNQDKLLKNQVAKLIQQSFAGRVEQNINSHRPQFIQSFRIAKEHSVAKNSDSTRLSKEVKTANVNTFYQTAEAAFLI